MADSPTIQVWTYLSVPAKGLHWHVEHNDPDRAGGHYANVAWPAGPVRAVVSLMTAAHAVLDAAGLIERARRRGHFFALMGFETNNPLHPDSPPHWHMAYYPGSTMSAARATVPHYWLDARGRTFFNGQDVEGHGRTPYGPGKPAPIKDAQGKVVVTTTVRRDGGLDMQAPGGTRYSIVAPGGDFTGPLNILANGAPWRTVTTSDDVHQGILDLDLRGFGANPVHVHRTYPYDPLTGALR